MSLAIKIDLASCLRWAEKPHHQTLPYVPHHRFYTDLGDTHCKEPLLVYTTINKATAQNQKVGLEGLDQPTSILCVLCCAHQQSSTCDGSTAQSYKRYLQALTNKLHRNLMYVHSPGNHGHSDFLIRHNITLRQAHISRVDTLFTLTPNVAVTRSMKMLLRRLTL
jgi:hypothetical protein